MDSISITSTLSSWYQGKGPLHRRLESALRQAIQSGAVRPGTRLPAERVLAEQLAISRSTVVAAYSSLREDHLVKSRQGSGTWVPGPPGEPPPETPVPRRSAVFRELIEGSGEAIEFLGAHFPACKELTPGLLAECGEELAALSSHPGYFPFGVDSLRQAIAEHLTSTGLATTKDQVLVTNGAQQAISLAAALHLRAGDAVAVENPTYITAIDVFQSLSARLVTAEVGAAGVRLDRLIDTVEKSGARLVYLMPTFHNPTGAVLPEAARRELSRWAARRGIVIVEDNTLADIALAGEPPPPIGAFAPSGTVYTIGSMSKLFWGGLRVGWIRASEQVVTKLARLRVVSDLGGSVAGQLLAARLLAKSAAVRADRRREASEKLTALASLLEQHLPSFTYQRPAGGLSLWTRLPSGDASQLAQVALRHGVSIVPGPVASPDGSFRDHVRVPFVLPVDRMAEGIRRLARAWAAYAPAAERRTLDVIV